MPTSEASERASSTVGESTGWGSEHAVPTSEFGGSNLHGNEWIAGAAHGAASSSHWHELLHRGQQFWKCLGASLDMKLMNAIYVS